jgi:D-arabinose 1-dehydrogenase-like Zn-dependent alcohol dehydrogenase
LEMVSGFGSVGMRAVWIAVLIGLMTVPAYAQNLMPGFKLNEGKTLSEDEIARNKANEDAAKEARSKIPDGKVSSDPWATVRTTEPAKATKSKPK